MKFLFGNLKKFGGGFSNSYFWNNWVKIAGRESGENAIPDKTTDRKRVYIGNEKNEELARRQTQNPSYPKGVYFVIAYEFFERLTFYGIISILSWFLREQLEMRSYKIKMITQVFLLFSYCFPIMGAILADCWLNKYRTILFMTPLYMAGTYIVVVAALPNMPALSVTLAGLCLAYLGLGGVRPCVVAFGGDQFILPQQESYLKKYFSVFYFTIYAGNFVAGLMVPALSERQCFGDEFCYCAGFSAVAVSMTVAGIVFISGKKLYYIRNPECNILAKVFRCICYALSKPRKGRGHWLDKASDRYDSVFINEVKTVLRILVLFMPLPLFRFIFDQHGPRWKGQAARMSGDIGKLKLEAQQMNSANSMLVLLFIPLFEAFLYPSFARYNYLKKPLQRLTVGGLLAALGFFTSALVELQLESTDEYLPRPNEAQIRLYNGVADALTLDFISPALEKQVVPSLGLYSKLDIPLKGKGVVKVRYAINGTQRIHSFGISENTLSTYIITAQRVIPVHRDKPKKSIEGLPKVRVIYLQSAPSVEIMAFFCDSKRKYVLTRDVPYSPYADIMDCDWYYVDRGRQRIFKKVPLKQGGVYVAFISERNGIHTTNLVTAVQPNNIHMLWLVPQYVFITAGEIMFSITGFEFSYTQAPVSMKTLLQAAWLMAAAIGKVIVLTSAGKKFFDRMFSEFLLFAGVLVVDMLIFAALATRYTYVKTVNEEPGPST